ncbi:MAG: glucosyltransferase domain-containing protein [Defluviitaleaceae bacterium]|nr:glucosyltransferase domain-containing protein [Defluviitaleaceae bacterium]
MRKYFEMLNDENIFIDLWNAQLPAWKAGFFSALIIGFITHLFIYTNRLINEDDLQLIIATCHNVGSGRWFNNVINNINYQFMLPVAVGLFQLAFLAVSVFLVCKVFEVTRKFSAFLIAGLMCTFPAIAYTNGYLIEGAGYYFAAMLSVAGFYITLKYKFGFLPGGLLLMLTMAIYQSKVSMALVLCLVYLIVQLKDSDVRSLRKNAINFLLLAVTGGLFYFASLQAVTLITGIPLSEYRGIDEMHVINFSELPRILFLVYAGFYRFFFAVFHSGFYSYHHTSNALAVVYAVVILISAGFVFKNYKGVRLIGALFISALIPFAANFSAFFEADNLASTLMIYAFVLVFVFAVILAERLEGSVSVKRIFSGSVLFIIANFVIISNIHYMNLNTYFNRTISITTRLLARIDPLIPYSQSNTIIVIGNLSESVYYPQAVSAFARENVKRTGLSGQFVGFSAYGYSSHQLAVLLNTIHGTRLTAAPPEQYSEILDKVITAQLPVFPREGSVAVIDDIIVINISPVAVVTGELTEGNALLIETRHTGRGLVGEVYTYFIYRNGNMVSYVSDAEAIHEIELHRSGTYEIRARVETSEGLLLAEVRSDEIEADLPAITVNIISNGITVGESFDITAIIRNDEIMMPLRFIAEHLGATVAWDNALGAVVLIYGGQEISDIPWMETEGVALVPFGFVEEFFSVRTAEWDAETSTAVIIAN